MKVKVCIGSACHVKGSYNVISRLQHLLEENQLSQQVEIEPVFCLGNCVHAVSVQIDDLPVQSVSKETVDAFFEQSIRPKLA